MKISSVSKIQSHVALTIITAQNVLHVHFVITMEIAMETELDRETVPAFVTLVILENLALNAIPDLT